MFVKCATTNTGRIIYCFRRSPSCAPIKDQQRYIRKILGLIAFRKSFLKELVKLPQAQTEVIESIEQMRIIENNYNLTSVPFKESLPSVNEPEEADIVIKYLLNNPTQKKLLEKTSLKLARRLSCIEHRANPMANIMNMTTKSQDLYPDLLGKKSAIWRFVNSFTGALVSVHKSCRYWHKKTQLEDLQTNTDVLIISHLTDQDHLKNDEDFYFGGLAKSIEAAGYNQYTILINHARCDVRNQAKPPNTSVLPAFLSPIEEIRIVSRMIYAAFSLPNIGKGPNEKRFHFLARIAQFNSRAIGDFRIGTLINQFIQRSKPRAVIHTYEGHGWERILSASAHSLPTPPLILGYQHAVLFPGKKSISHDYGVAMPDHVFTQGDITRTAIINEGSLPENYFTTLGSIKSKSRNKNITFV